MSAATVYCRAPIWNSGCPSSRYASEVDLPRPEGHHSVKQLRLGVLAGLFVVAGVLSWAAARLWDSVSTLPSVPIAAPIVLGVIAVILLATALSIRARLRAQRERRPEAKGVEP